MLKETTLEAKCPRTRTIQRGVVLPVTLPFTLVDKGKKVVQLPLALPFTFEESDSSRKEILLNVKEQCKFIRTNKSIKIPLKEQVAAGKNIKIPLTETALTFEGFVITENVIDTMNSTLPIVEEVRNRILVDVSMIDRNTLVLNWYGEKVDELDVMIRPFVEEEYQLYSTHEWREGQTTVTIDDNAYYIQLVGKNGSGESFELEIDISTPVSIKSDVTISLNEKIYDIDVDYISAYRFEASL